MKEYEVIAWRQDNAVNHFSGLCADLGFTKDQALHILKVFKKVKAVRLDSIMGRYYFTHGVYFDKDVMQRALDQQNAAIE